MRQKFDWDWEVRVAISRTPIQTTRKLREKDFVFSTVSKRIRVSIFSKPKKKKNKNELLFDECLKLFYGLRWWSVRLLLNAVTYGIFRFEMQKQKILCEKSNNTNAVSVWVLVRYEAPSNGQSWVFWERTTQFSKDEIHRNYGIKGNETRVQFDLFVVLCASEKHFRFRFKCEKLIIGVRIQWNYYV